MDLSTKIQMNIVTTAADCRAVSSAIARPTSPASANTSGAIASSGMVLCWAATATSARGAAAWAVLSQRVRLTHAAAVRSSLLENGVFPAPHRLRTLNLDLFGEALVGPVAIDRLERLRDLRVAPREALIAALAYLVAHAAYKGALFLVAGAIDHETGTRDIAALGGLRRTMPITAVAGGAAALSMAGIPLTFGFIAGRSAAAEPAREV